MPSKQKYPPDKRGGRIRGIRISSVILSVFLLALGIGIIYLRDYYGITGIGDTHNITENVSDPTSSLSYVDSSPELIPEFSGEDYVILNDNQPCFDETDIETITGEHYSSLDSLGRCGTAYAMLDRSMMPKEERQDVRGITPSGWCQAKYEGIIDANPPYLYNRCHLIGYVFTGQNANELNLITGTRYMNYTTMYPWEQEVIKGICYYKKHVLYRVSPYFKDRELVARGVEIEALSIEDYGESTCFHVFVYNYQPGVTINYANGGSWRS